MEAISIQKEFNDEVKEAKFFAKESKLVNIILKIVVQCVINHHHELSRIRSKKHSRSKNKPILDTCHIILNYMS